VDDVSGGAALLASAPVALNQVATQTGTTQRQYYSRHVLSSSHRFVPPEALHSLAAFTEAPRPPTRLYVRLVPAAFKPRPRLRLLRLRFAHLVG
jgi:hypothetical protein